MRSGFEPFAELNDLVGRRRRAQLAADGIVDTREELDVRAVELPCPVADPEHVSRAVVPIARERVAPRQPFLVVEQEPFVARPDVDLVQLWRGGEVDPARGHEGERALDLRGELLVALALRRVGDEVLVPGVHLRQVGEAALGEGADEVQRRRRVVVAVEHPLGVGDARVGGRGVVVDHVAAEDGDLPVGRPLEILGARLHELARDPPHLQHRQGGPIRENCGHLQENLQPLADRDRRVGGAGVGEAREVVERLGAVARLEQERPPRGDLAERRLDLARLACKDERRQRVQLPAHRFGARLVGPLRLLEGLELPPRGRGPCGRKCCHANQCRHRAERSRGPG